MSKKTIIAESILETLAECESGRGLPEGHMYVAVMRYISLHAFQGIIRELQAAGYVEICAHYVTATEKARALYARTVTA